MSVQELNTHLRWVPASSCALRMAQTGFQEHVL